MWQLHTTLMYKKSYIKEILKMRYDYHSFHTLCINFSGKAYDASKVLVSSIPWGTIGKAVDFTVDASKAGEGNLEITISARGRNIPTQVHPQGSAKFVVSFVPLEGIDHIINITFNKELVTGAPFTAKIHTGKQF